MPSERGKTIAVGLTALLGLLILLSLMVVFGYMPEMLKSGYQVTIELPTAEGLHSGSRVLLNGIDVGEVETVALQPNVIHGTTVTARITQKDLRLPKSVRARLNSPLLGGGSKVELAVGRAKDNQTPSQPKAAQLKRAKAEILPTDGSAVIQGKAGTLTEQITNELQAAMAEPTRQFKELTTTIKNLSQVWQKVGVNVRKMTDPHSPADVDAGQVMGNLASVVTRIDSRLSQMKTTLNQLNQWVGDKQLRGDVKTAAKNVSSASQRIETSIASIQKQAAGLSDDLSRITDSAAALFKQAKDGQGSLGKAITDPDLYNNLNDAANHMKSAVDEIKLLVEKWKKEGLPVQF